MYGDRCPIFVPKLDFSVLPNFRRPKMYNHQVAKGHLKKYGGNKNHHDYHHQGGNKNNKGLKKGIVGFLSLKFWH